jgi:hypothetical protein
MKKRYPIPADLTPRERRILSIVRKVVRNAAWNYGALEPGDNRNDNDPSARCAEKMRDEVLWYLDPLRIAGRKR